MKNAKTSGPEYSTAVPIPIGERTVAYSVRVIRLYRRLARDSAGRVIARQLLRSATSIGANVHEAQAGQSRADFIAKMSIAHKEATESRYWLRLITEARLLPAEKLRELQDETEQIIRVLGSILVSTKSHGARESLAAYVYGSEPDGVA